MKEQRINAAIAITTVIAAVIMVFALSFAIGKWSMGKKGHILMVRFPNASGITPNSEVKYAGATAGRVQQVRLLARADETEDPLTKQFNCVEIVLDVDPKIELGQDVVATIKQDGFGISAKYVLLMPGPDHNSPVLADGAVVQGAAPYDLGDLIQPAGEALTQARALVMQLQPILTRLDETSQKLDPMVDHADKFLQDGDAVLGNFNTAESRERINTMMASLSVATENLKVVSSNAKALTATLAQKPWRVFWGGSTVSAPSENEVLKSDSVIRLKPDVEVTGASGETAKKKTP